jgi:hypothetical protein
MTRESVCAGLLYPGIVVEDRGGEVVHLAYPSQAQALPAADEIGASVRCLPHQCPEGDGQAK